MNNPTQGSITTPSSNLTASKEKKLGFIFAVSSFLIWGFFPLFLKNISFAGALEIMSHRVIWALPFCAIILFTSKQWHEVKDVFYNKKTLLGLVITTILIASSWLIFIYAVNANHVLEASLGYFINPLVNVVLGIIFFKEKLNKLQLIALLFAFFGVAILTISLGKLPIISLSLAISFGFYGLIRKSLSINSMPGLFIETLFISPFCFFYIFYLNSHGQSHFSFDLPWHAMPWHAMPWHAMPWHAFLLILSGPLTALPLFLFTLGARRLPYSTIGFIQFIAPSLHFITGILYGEAFTLGYIFCFTFLWIGLSFFAINLYKTSRKNLKATLKT